MLFSNFVYAQSGVIDNDNIQGTILRRQVEDDARLISTGVPLLLIAPDARAGALGDLGAASTPDANSNHWNAAKLPLQKRSLQLLLLILLG